MSGSDQMMANPHMDVNERMNANHQSDTRLRSRRSNRVAAPQPIMIPPRMAGPGGDFNQGTVLINDCVYMNKISNKDYYQQAPHEADYQSHYHNSHSDLMYNPSCQEMGNFIRHNDSYAHSEYIQQGNSYDSNNLLSQHSGGLQHYQ
jgi:hypothetical protein